MFDSIEDVESMTIEDIVRCGITDRRSASVASIATDERSEAEFLDKMKSMPASHFMALYLDLRFRSTAGDTIANLAYVLRQIHEQCISEQE